MSVDRQAARRRILDPIERYSEILFGLIMALTFTGSISAATAGRDDIRTMIFGAVGCNLAWGIVDAVMYLLTSLAGRGRGVRTLDRLRRAVDAGEAHRIVADALPPAVASVMEAGDLESLRQRIVRLPVPPRPRLGPDDWLGAFAVLLIVFLSTFPLVIPFLFVHQTVRAMRLSNGIALVMLWFGGYQLGHYSGLRPVVTGFSMVGIGVVLVLVTVALGG